MGELFFLQLLAFDWQFHLALSIFTAPEGLKSLLIISYSMIFAAIEAALFLPLISSKSSLNLRSLFMRVPICILIESFLPRPFPWTYGHLFHENLGILRWASVIGFQGLTAIILISSYSIATNIYEKKYIKAFAFMSIFPILGLIPLKMPQEGKSLRTLIVQPNIRGNNPASFMLLKEMTENALKKQDSSRLDLIVWPESVIPMDYFFHKKEELQTWIKSLHQNIMIHGIIPYDTKRPLKEKFLYRSVSFLWDNQGRIINTYDKHRGFPLGESHGVIQYIPWILPYFDSSMTQGEIQTSDKETIFKIRDQSIAPLICYDAVDTNWVNHASKSVQGFIHQSNTSWLEISPDAIYGFPMTYKFRAIQTGKSFLSVSNSGPSIGYHPNGTLFLEPTQIQTSLSEVIDFPMYSKNSFYIVYGQWINLFILLLSVLLFLRYELPFFRS